MKFAKISTLSGAALALFLGSTEAQANDKVSIIMSWLPDPQHGGYYQAQATGLYQQQGLDVTIRPGGPQTNSAELLAAGAVDMRVASNSGSGLNDVEQDIPDVVIAAFFQKEPSILMSHPGSGNDSLAAMKGKPIAISQQVIDTWWPFLKARFGFTDSQIRPYTFNLASFILDKNAISQGYLTGEPYMVEQQGHFEPLVFLLADKAGYNSYAQTLETTRAMIDKRPDVVQRFVNATIDGWYSYLYGDPKPANDLMKRDNNDLNDDLIAYSMAKMKEYGIVDSSDTKSLGIGAMTDARWKSFFETAVKVGLYPATVDYRKAYTLRFVDQKVGLK